MNIIHYIDIDSIIYYKTNSLWIRFGDNITDLHITFSIKENFAISRIIKEEIDEYIIIGFNTIGE